MGALWRPTTPCGEFLLIQQRQPDGWRGCVPLGHTTSCNGGEHAERLLCRVHDREESVELGDGKHLINFGSHGAADELATNPLNHLIKVHEPAESRRGEEVHILEGDQDVDDISASSQLVAETKQFLLHLIDPVVLDDLCHTEADDGHTVVLRYIETSVCAHDTTLPVKGTTA